MTTANSKTKQSAVPLSVSKRVWFSIVGWFLALSICTLVISSVEIVLRTWRPEELQIIDGNTDDLAFVDPHAGRSLYPSKWVEVREPEFRVRYETNAEGLRDRVSHPSPKPPYASRFLLLGDSFTYGVGNDYDDIWPVKLEQEFAKNGYKYDIVKAGVPGSDTLDAVLRLKKLLPVYQPDVVIIAFLPNDLDNNELSLSDRTNKVDPEIASPTPILPELHLIRFLKRQLRGNDSLFIKLHLRRYGNRRAYIYPEENWFKHHMEVTRTLLNEANELCKEHSADLLLLSIPQEVQVILKARNRFPDGIDVENIDRHLSAIAREGGFSFKTALPTLAAHYRERSEKQYFRLDQHLNKLGNELVGQWLAKELMAEPRKHLQTQPAIRSSWVEEKEDADR